MYIVCFLTFRKILQNFIVFNIVEGLQINFKAGCQEGIPRMGQYIFDTETERIFFAGAGRGEVGLEDVILLLSLIGVLNNK